MTIAIKQVHPLFVGEVSGIDLRRPLAPDTFHMIAGALDRFAVLIFRGQPIDDEQQIAFSGLFGPLETSIGIIRKDRKQRLRRELADISNLDENNTIRSSGDRSRMIMQANQLWHTDSSFKRVPGKISLLSAREVPPAGGDTQFADLRAAYEALDEATRTRIEGLIAEHSIFHSRSLIGYSDFADEERAALPPAPQTVVRLHPGSRRKSLYLASHASHIIGWPLAQGRALLDELTEFATARRFVYRHRWQVGDLVVWDNRCTLHRARPYDDVRHRRDMRRTTVEDSAPTLEPGSLARRHIMKGETPMTILTRRAVVAGLTSFAALAASSGSAFSQKKYDVGATDTEIKVGNIMPYSGPASVWSMLGRTEAAYFKKINAEGGINGRKINFISYDDAYSPPKTVEQARKLVESDEVLLIFNSLGTASNTAIQKYMNSKGVPQLFIATGATKWNDPKNFPWTMGWIPNYQNEARIYAKYILKEKPKARIAVLYQNDDYGKDYLVGLKDGLGDKAASMIVAEDAYEVTEPTIDTHIVKMKSLNADVFIDITGPKFAAQAIKKAAEIGWKPLHFLSSVSTSIGAVIKPAGVESALGIVSVAWFMDPLDPQWKDDPGMKAFDEFLAKDYPEGNRADGFVESGYNYAQTLVQVLKQCGDNLTRENVMKQAANLKNFRTGTLLLGIIINTSPTDFAPIKQVQLRRFNGEKWEPFGPILSGEIGG